MAHRKLLSAKLPFKLRSDHPCNATRYAHSCDTLSATQCNACEGRALGRACFDTDGHRAPIDPLDAVGQHTEHLVHDARCMLRVASVTDSSASYRARRSCAPRRRGTSATARPSCLRQRCRHLKLRCSMLYCSMCGQPQLIATAELSAVRCGACGSEATAWVRHRVAVKPLPPTVRDDADAMLCASLAACAICDMRHATRATCIRKHAPDEMRHAKDIM